MYLWMQEGKKKKKEAIEDLLTPLPLWGGTKCTRRIPTSPWFEDLKGKKGKEKKKKEHTDVANKKRRRRDRRTARERGRPRSLRFGENNLKGATDTAFLARLRRRRGEGWSPAFLCRRGQGGSRDVLRCHERESLARAHLGLLIRKRAVSTISARGERKKKKKKGLERRSFAADVLGRGKGKVQGQLLPICENGRRGKKSPVISRSPRDSRWKRRDSSVRF